MIVVNLVLSIQNITVHYVIEKETFVMHVKEIKNGEKFAMKLVKDVQIIHVNLKMVNVMLMLIIVLTEHIMVLIAIVNVMKKMINV